MQVNSMELLYSVRVLLCICLCVSVCVFEFKVIDNKISRYVIIRENTEYYESIWCNGMMNQTEYIYILKAKNIFLVHATRYT